MELTPEMLENHPGSKTEKTYKSAEEFLYDDD